MRKKLLLGMVVVIAVLFCAAGSQAITIGFSPVSQDVALGDQAFVDLAISGLGDGAAPSLGVFDLDVSFDPLVLNLSSVSFGDQLDILGLGSWKEAITGVGMVNLFELSFDSPDDLDSLQADSFVLASLTFDTLALGESPLTLSIKALGDSWGDPLIADVQSGSVSVVPEPSTILLVGSGLVGLGCFRKKFYRKCQKDA